jgi:hypothetical protein
MAVLPGPYNSVIDPSLTAVITDTLPNCVFVHSSSALVRVCDEVLARAAMQVEQLYETQEESKDATALPLMPSSFDRASSSAAASSASSSAAASAYRLPSRRRFQNPQTSSHASTRAGAHNS